LLYGTISCPDEIATEKKEKGQKKHFCHEKKIKKEKRRWRRHCCCTNQMLHKAMRGIEEKDIGQE